MTNKNDNQNHSPPSSSQPPLNEEAADEATEAQNSAKSGGPKFMSRPDDVRPKPKRFYKDVTLLEEGDHFTLHLDGRPVKTPMKNALLVSAKPLAKAAQAEWQAQEKHIDLETMIITKLINTAIDRVATRRHEIIDEITRFAGTDLLCYRASNHEALHAREAEIWDPYLSWLQQDFNINFKTTSGITHVEQAENELQKLKNELEKFDEFTLTAAHNITTLTGSAILSFALLKGQSDHEKIWQDAHIDEDFQIERWGFDEEAARRRQLRLHEFLKTYEFYQLSCN